MKRKCTKSIALMTLAPLLTVTLISTAQTAQQSPNQSNKQQQQNQRQWQRPSQTPGAQHQTQNLQFVTFDEMKGLNIRSISEETLGEVSDLVMECRSGRLAYVLLDFGGTLGIGQKTKAIPYSAFQYGGTNDDGVILRLDMVKTDLEAAPEFDKDKWSMTNHRSWDEKLGDYWKDFTDNFDKQEPKSWRDAVQTGEKKTINGKVVNVMRLEDTRPERVALLVESEKGERQVVYLGPSWWVLSQDPAPQVGDNVTITAYPIKDQRNPTVVATTIRNGNGKTIVLRQEDGRTTWMESRDETRDRRAADDAMNNNNNNNNNEPGRYCLVSDLINTGVTAQGADAGHIDTVYIECTTGQVAFLGIDPDEKVADIGEVNRIIPYELESIAADKKIALRTDVARLTNGMETPDDADELNNPAYRTQVYNHYGVNERSFKSHAMRDHDDDWQRMSNATDRDADTAATKLRVALANGERVSVNGEVVRVRQDASTDPALGNMAIVVRTSNGEETIHLGPSSEFARKLDLKPGQNVDIRAIRADVDGRKTLVARTITVDGKTHELRDPSGKPNWDTR